MRLNKCYITNFGNLSNFECAFEKGLNTVIEPNGWGKSTFAAFVKAMFYGLGKNNSRDITKNDRKKYAPWQGGKFGGNLEFEHMGISYRIERFFGAKESEDTFEMYNLDTNKLINVKEDDKGKRIFFQLDCEAYERSVYFPQSTTRATLNDSLSAKLANLVENTDDINNYESAMKSLDEARMKYKKMGNRGLIYDLDKEIDEIVRNIDKLRHTYREIDIAKLEVETRTKKCETLSEEIALAKASIVTAIQDKERNAGKIALNEQYKALKAAKDEAESAYNEAQSVMPDTKALSKSSKAGGGARVGGVIGLIVAIVATIIGIAGVIMSNLFMVIPGFGIALAGLGLAGYLLVLLPKKSDANGANKDNLTNISSGEQLTTLKLAMDMRKQDLEMFCGKNNFDPAQYSTPLLEVNIEALQASESTLSKEYDNLRGSIATLTASITTKEEAVSELSALEAKLEVKRTQKSESENKLLAITKCMELLKKAKENMQQSYVRPMQKSFAKYAEVFAGSELSGHVMDTDLGLKFERFGQSKSVDYLNAGHRDMVDICVRLSLIDALWTGGQKPFIIMDDPFVNLDRQKLAAAIGALQRLAKEYQIIYFTCHQSRA